MEKSHQSYHTTKFDNTEIIIYDDNLLMKRVGLLFLLIFGYLFFKSVSEKTYAQEVERAYFKLKSANAFSLVVPYIHHEFDNQTFSIQAPQSVIDKLKNNPNLEFKGMVSLWKVFDSKLPLVPELPSLNNISRRSTSALNCSPSSQVPWGVTKVNGGSGGSGVIVAVLDTGVKTDHPDLKSNIVDCTDAQYSSLRKRCSDKNGHGTHVAGTIAANGKIVGVAPQAKIAAVQVCSSGGYCWSDDVARGIRYAADKGYQVVNLSLGGSSMTSVEKDAIDYATNKGVLVIAAAGNSGPAIGSINYPGAYYKVVAVGATQSSDSIPSFSSRGTNPGSQVYVVEEKDIEFAAPGVSVESTYKDRCYAVGTGTSMATPHVSGLSAKLWQGSAQNTREYLQNRAKLYDLDIAGDDPASGFGLATAP